MNDASIVIGSLPRHQSGVSFLIPRDRSQHCLAIPYKCECCQLHVRNFQQQEHTKLKTTKIYSKGGLVNHTKKSTNKNFSLYTVHGSCQLHSFLNTHISAAKKNSQDSANKSYMYSTTTLQVVSRRYYPAHMHKGSCNRFCHVIVFFLSS